MNILGGSAGGMAGSVLGGPAGAGMGAAVGTVATPYLATKTMMSGPMQRYLTKGFAPKTAASLGSRQVPLSAIESVIGAQNR